ncbi:MAG: hypothetical protein IPO21_14725 [Bacteroidales bacterium]|nr:hypothetical protein [Bacteroidales bacterium]
MIKIEEWYKNEEFKHSLVLGVIVGHEFLISHFGLLIEADFHFYNPFYKRFYSYSIETFNSLWIKSILGGRLGFNYYPFKKSYIMKNNVGIGLYLKTHLGQADCVEMNLMYSF